MNKEKLELLREFINAYKNSSDKEAFIDMWDSMIPSDFNNFVEEEPMTLQDAYECAYGRALAQL